MKPGELKAILSELGLSQLEFARLLGHGARTGQYWANESVPASVATLARLLQRHPALVDEVREIAAQRERGPVDDHTSRQIATGRTALPKGSSSKAHKKHT